MNRQIKETVLLFQVQSLLLSPMFLSERVLWKIPSAHTIWCQALDPPPAPWCLQRAGHKAKAPMRKCLVTPISTGLLVCFSGILSTLITVIFFLLCVLINQKKIKDGSSWPKGCRPLLRTLSLDAGQPIMFLLYLRILPWSAMERSAEHWPWEWPQHDPRKCSEWPHH